MGREHRVKLGEVGENMMGLKDSPYHACQSVTIAIRIFGNLKGYRNMGYVLVGAGLR